MPADPDLVAWRAELLDGLGELVSELGRLRVAVEVIAGEAVDRQLEREAREAELDRHPSSTIEELDPEAPRAQWARELDEPRGPSS